MIELHNNNNDLSHEFGYDYLLDISKAILTQIDYKGPSRWKKTLRLSPPDESLSPAAAQPAPSRILTCTACEGHRRQASKSNMAAAPFLARTAPGKAEPLAYYVHVG